MSPPPHRIQPSPQKTTINEISAYQVSFFRYHFYSPAIQRMNCMGESATAHLSFSKDMLYDL
jgi:hypothetical protein